MLKVLDCLEVEGGDGAIVVNDSNILLRKMPLGKKVIALGVSLIESKTVDLLEEQRIKVSYCDIYTGH